MKTHFFAYAVLLLLMKPYHPGAQQVAFNRVFPPDGSYFGLVNSITQDSLGYMWFAAYERGLHRYDGYHAIAYLNDPLNPSSLASNNLEAVCADHNGIIWIGTQQSGLDRFDPSTGIFTHFKNKKNDSTSLSDDRITTILEDNEGVLWVGTRNGLNKLDQKTGTFTRYCHNPNDSTSLSYNRVRVLYEDHRNTLWVGTAGFDKDDRIWTKEGGLNRFDKKTNKFTRFLHNPNDSSSLSDNKIAAIFEDSKQNFWIYTAGDGLHTMDRKKGIFQRYRYNPVHPEKLSGPPRKKEAWQDLDLFFICEDGAGAIWMGASGGWITRYDLNTKKITHYDSFNGDTLSMHTVTGAFTSSEGILWFRSWIGSIYQVNPFQSTIQHFPTGSIVHAIHEDASGNMWLGTFDGLIQIDRTNGNIKRFSSGAPGPSNFNEPSVAAFYEENDSTLWIGSGKGLSRYNIRTKAFTHFVNDPNDENSLSKDGVVDIIEDNHGALWIATQNGLDHFNIKSGIFQHYRRNPKDSNSISHNELTSLLKDRSGNLWIGTPHGTLNLFNHRTGNFKHFILSGAIGAITQDYEGIIWVGTSSGLYKSNTAIDSFSRFTNPRVAITPTTTVTAILEDNQKNLWVASAAGILRFSSNRKEISVYNKNQGVDASSLTFFIMRGEKGRRGEFFFSNNTGFYSFFPDQFKTNTTPPQIVISDFRLVNELVKPGKGSVLTAPVTQTKKINLKYNQNTLSFDFAAIHFSSPQDNQHFFMLENLDNTWRKAGVEKTAYYYNVRTGKYIFRVKAANSDGVWAEKAIVVIINPPWYRTWWAYSLYIFIFLAALWGFVRWRERALKKEKVLLEEKVALRTHQLQEEKEKAESTLTELKATQAQLIQSEKMAALSKLQEAMLYERLRISRELHDDIGSTLSGIVLYSHLAENQVQAQQADEVKNSLNIIQQSANAMVSKLNDIVWAVNPEHNSLKSLMQKLEEYATEMAMVKNIKIQVNAPEHLVKLQLPVETCHNIYLLCKEAINNAVKYSQASLLELSVQHFDHVMEFTIKDNGEGFDMITVKKGNGLMNMQKRADEAGAMLCVKSIARQGTVISLQYKIT